MTEVSVAKQQEEAVEALARASWPHSTEVELEVPDELKGASLGVLERLVSQGYTIAPLNSGVALQPETPCVPAPAPIAQPVSEAALREAVEFLKPPTNAIGWFCKSPAEMVREKVIIIESALSELAELRAAAQAVVERWDSPKWKEQPHTAGFIDRLRKALPTPPAVGAEQEVR